MVIKTELKKKDMRRAAILCRNNKPHITQSHIKQKLFHNFFDNFDVLANTNIAGYWAKGSEIDIKPILVKLYEDACNCLLPSIGKSNEGLKFRDWGPSDKLILSKFGILEPARAKAVRIPSIILLPLLAFDKRGHRLGYGGGYYDRTLMHLRKITEFDGITAIGVCYADQEVDEIPNDKHDERLNWILTEKGVFSFDKNKN